MWTPFFSVPLDFRSLFALHHMNLLLIRIVLGLVQSQVCVIRGIKVGVRFGRVSDFYLVRVECKRSSYSWCGVRVGERRGGEAAVFH